MSFYVWVILTLFRRWVIAWMLGYQQIVLDIAMSYGMSYARFI
jgi:hypothetical protein